MSNVHYDIVNEPEVVHRQASGHYDILGDHTYYPINHQQLRTLLGRLLTQLDAMALPDRTHKAARTLLVQEVWRWWDGVHENATTSYQGCIAPIVMNGNPGFINDHRTVSDPDPVAPSNRWGWASEQMYLDSRVPAVVTSD